MLNMNKFNADYQMGTQKEKDLLQLLQNNLDNELQLSPHKNAVFDYCSSKSFAELKTRNNKKDDYPDTMIPKNKVDYAADCFKDCYFIFCFVDGVYYWKYNDSDYFNGVIRVGQGGRYDRGKDERKEYYFIKNEALIKLEDNLIET